MIHKYEVCTDRGIEQVQYDRFRREFDRGERLWKATCWVLTGLLAALLCAAQVH